MRIDRIELFHIRMRLRAPFETSFGVDFDRECLLIRLDAEGVSGWGECVADQWPGYCYETASTAWVVLSSYLIPSLFKRPLEQAGDLRPTFGAVRGHPLAKAGLELAVWDWLGRASGRSLRNLLGGERRSVEVGVSVGIQPDPAALVRLVEDYVRQGYRRVKLKIKPGRDLAETESVRRAFPDLRLQVDANSAYRLDHAPVFEAMDGLGLLLIEQPLAEDDLIDHGRLQARLKTPICLDESVVSERHARQALEIGACRVINIKPARVGGLSEAVAIHDLCLRQGTPVWCGGMLETGIGRAANLALASLPGFVLPGDISASDRYYAEDIAEPRFALNPDSTITVPDGPGLGVEVVPEALGRVTLRRELLRA